MKPEITVLMPAYNCESFICESIGSVLKQTFADFELIVIDSGSTDGTKKEVEKFDDSRIRILCNEHDLATTLNNGIKNARGKYVAWTDGKDLMNADRLMVQHTILSQSPDVDICGCWVQLYGQQANQHVARNVSGFINQPLVMMLRSNFVFPSTIMCKASFLKKQDLLYSPVFKPAEEYAFWSDAARAGGRFFIESQVLQYFRIPENPDRVSETADAVGSNWKIKHRIIGWLLEQNPNDDVASLYRGICHVNENKLLTDSMLIDVFYQIFVLMEKRKQDIQSPIRPEKR